MLFLMLISLIINHDVCFILVELVIYLIQASTIWSNYVESNNTKYIIYCVYMDHGTTTWLKFNSSLVRSESRRRTLIWRLSIVPFPFCMIGSIQLTFFVWKFLHRKTHCICTVQQIIEKNTKEIFKLFHGIWYKTAVCTITVNAANKIPILAPAKTSHQWWRWSVIRDNEHKHAYNRNTHWMVGSNRRLRIRGERICRNLKYKKKTKNIFKKNQSQRIVK